MIGRPAQNSLPITEKVSAIPAGQRGLHAFDYDGGIDQGVRAAGQRHLRVRAVAQDLLGQQMQVESQVTIVTAACREPRFLWAWSTFRPRPWSKGQVLDLPAGGGELRHGAAPHDRPIFRLVYDSMSTNANAVGRWRNQVPGASACTARPAEPTTLGAGRSAHPKR
jgi:hypothetical protein